MTATNQHTSRGPVLRARTFQPRRYRPGVLGTWSGHLAFVNDLIAELRPSLLVELGTHYGESYFGMCQSVQENGVSCQCYAIDTWQGDLHAGYYDESVFAEVNSYNENHYDAFSKLLRTTFDEARQNFGEGTVDLLHIDGLHTYTAVQHDFYNWFPAVRPGGVVLIHDTAARHSDFQVWKLWDELAREFPHFEFHHSWGLGVLRKPGAPDTERDFLQDVVASARSEQDFLRHYYATHAELAERRLRGVAIDGSLALTSFQVFPCLAGGYSEETRAATPVTLGAWQQVLLELPQGSGNGRIRVDPAQRPCLIEIAGVVLKRAVDGSILESWTAAAGFEGFSPEKDLVRLKNDDGLSFLSTGNDPQLLLPPISQPRSDQPLVFEARVRVEEDLAAAVALLQSVPDHLPGAATPDLTTPGREAALADRDAALADRDAAFAERDRAASEREAAVLRGEQLTAEIRNLQAERVALVADYRRVHGISDSLANQVASLQTSLSASQAEGAASEEEAQALRGQLEKALQEQERLAKELHIVLTSRSWRLTAPLRGLYRATR